MVPKELKISLILSPPKSENIYDVNTKKWKDQHPWKMFLLWQLKGEVTTVMSINCIIGNFQFHIPKQTFVAFYTRFFYL